MLRISPHENLLFEISLFQSLIFFNKRTPSQLLFLHFIDNIFMLMVAPVNKTPEDEIDDTNFHFCNLFSK